MCDSNSSSAAQTSIQLQVVGERKRLSLFVDKLKSTDEVKNRKSIYWNIADEGMSKREMGKLEELSLQHKSIFICSQVTGAMSYSPTHPPPPSPHYSGFSLFYL